MVGADVVEGVVLVDVLLVGPGVVGNGLVLVVVEPVDDVVEVVDVVEVLPDGDLAVAGPATKSATVAASELAPSAVSPMIFLFTS